MLDRWMSPAGPKTWYHCIFITLKVLVMSSSVMYAKKEVENMSRRMEMRMLSLLAALMLMSAMFVPAASAAVVPGVSAEKSSERLTPSPWETDHTIR